MISLEFKLDLPEHLIHEAEAFGLLTPQSIEFLIREEIRRRRANEFFEIADQLAALDLPPMTDAEVEAEVQAARRERRARHASGG